MSSQSQDVYVQDSFSEPMSAQHSFAANFDLDNPAKAAAEYSRIILAHTQRQFNTISPKSDRRSTGGSSTSLTSQSSVDSSQSTASS